MVNAPSSGLAVAFEFQRVRPGAGSGLSVTSAVITYTGSVYYPMQSEPKDDVETVIVAGADALINAYTGDFDLGGNVREVDLLGQTGQSLSADGGYYRHGDVTYRAAVVTIPLIVNDVWVQVS